MSAAKGAMPVIVSVGIVAAVTLPLWYVKLTALTPHHLVYFYLMPIVLIAMLFGDRLAIVSTILAVFCGDYFLQDPLYDLTNSNPLEYGDLLCLAVLAVTAIKTVRELMRPRAAIQEARPRYERGR
jgi:K+-sensing histidine kinase KdpD